MVERQRKMDEERQAFEREQKRRQKAEQEVILNKKSSRPKLSFGFKKTDSATWKDEYLGDYYELDIFACRMKSEVQFSFIFWELRFVFLM